MICQNCGYDDNGTGDFAHACKPLNLSDPAVQKRLATQWGYVQKPHPDCDEGCMFQCAQPAPTALLVAVADLIAQMEIVSRVGFVDTPDDKDSCAAFCVAEGSWLELMSAVESLASALAAAPEAKL